MKLDLDTLKLLLEAETDDLFEHPEKYWNVTNLKKEKTYLYFDNGATVLAVAHLDTVLNYKIKNSAKSPGTNSICMYKKGADDVWINSICLDDRLGLFIIMDVLPRLGINVDVLLTLDEEIGQSTASDFKTDKQYNWIFQLDRHHYGTVVMYQYHEQYLVDILEDEGYEVEHGTYTDICTLDHLGCVGFNFGVGYENEHTQWCNTRTSWINVCVNMFAEFYLQYWDIEFPYVQKANTWESGHYRDYDDWDDDKYNNRFLGTGTTGVASGTQYAYTRCVECGEFLLADEIDVCELCAKEEQEWAEKHNTLMKCWSCGVSFSGDDINDDGVCLDCEKMLGID